MGDHQDQNARTLFEELKEFEKKGVYISLNGLPASPMQIVQAHIMRENIIYMRDYIMNEKGDIKSVSFQNIKL